MSNWKALIVIVGVLAAGSEAESRLSAKEAFANIQKALKEVRKERAAARRFDKALFTQQVYRTRLSPGDLYEDLLAATVTKVIEKENRALVVFRTPDLEERASLGVLMKKERTEWRIASGRSLVLSGNELAKRCGTKPARARLSMRMTNDSYGAGAYSFTCVSGDMKKFKNRADVWFCHNQDLHVKGEAVDLGKVALQTVNAIPVDGAWTKLVQAKPGHTYVLRCGADKRRDFFVALHVKRIKRGVLEFEWTLLAVGWGAPLSIHAEHVTEEVARAGTDGPDGLCHKD